MNIQEATPIELTEQERSVLEAMIRSAKTEHGTVERARIVLLAAQGRSTRSIASELGTWPGRVSRWRTRFAAQRLAGLHDLPRPGATPRYGSDSDKRILALLDQGPPAGYGRWTAPLLARELGDPKATRAVARACAVNRVALIVPCHRVVGASGSLTGYRWGVERKRQLLAAESR